MAGNFAQGPFCKPLARKFPRNSPPCRVPRQIPDTLSHSPHLHHPPPPIIPETTTWGKCLSPNTQTVSQAISVLATALRTAISSCYLLSAAIWRYLSTGRPCLSPVCNSDCQDTPCHLQSLPFCAILSPYHTTYTILLVYFSPPPFVPFFRQHHPIKTSKDLKYGLLGEVKASLFAGLG